MSAEHRYDLLFEPVQIGPVIAPNRFYQVPHCTGMGFRMPKSLAAMRETKAEGGWGVVCTEYCSIHPSSDELPLPSASLWNEDDVRAQALMTEKVHRHGALAGVELWHGGGTSANLYTREGAIGARSRPARGLHPVQCRAMDKRDIRELRKWHVDAARRAQRAGFDIVYVYATHGYLLAQFLSPENQRSDEYGGSLENRVRLIRELLEDTKEAVGETCGIALRLATSSGGPDGKPDTEEKREVVALLADLPDLWDLSVHDYSYEMGSSRFTREAALENYVSWVKQATQKPVVGVGRFTSPDTMLRQVKDGILDLVGAARPSIADPFLPNKIKQGRLADIRECIGCNLCYASDYQGIPIRCTQNPAMGEEWRRGWHPEFIPAATSEKTILVVGGGPAGLEAARALGQRGYAVTLAERTRALGGRVTRESSLPGLAEWSRVRDWRIGQIEKFDNVEVFLESELEADQILEFGSDRVVLATGADWRHDGVGRWHANPIEGWRTASVLTPDDIMAGSLPEGPVLVFDDDHYYMGGVVAELLAAAGRTVTLVTTAFLASAWTDNTAERERIQARLINGGVQIEANTVLVGLAGEEATLACVFTGARHTIQVASIIMVTARVSRDGLYRELEERIDITRIGDCLAPGTIAACVRSGHEYAREIDADPEREDRVRHEAANR
ncbi:MAG: FAD-dependent oxidoreductase [Deltaproteobacteria bacterium]|nr:FAD-dependent oxidoreductase [Deltaproteobacteria bacterium]MBW2397779.1 FAD-dependent oxidoreductase [Deltaproteobacteria bacterium]